jgi:hypothetical protein
MENKVIVIQMLEEMIWEIKNSYNNEGSSKYNCVLCDCELQLETNRNKYCDICNKIKQDENINEFCKLYVNNGRNINTILEQHSHKENIVNETYDIITNIENLFVNNEVINKRIDCRIDIGDIES